MGSNPHDEDDCCKCELCQEAQIFHAPGPLEDAVWLWREKFGLFTIEQRMERLAQEAFLHIVANDNTRS